MIMMTTTIMMTMTMIMISTHDGNNDPAIDDAGLRLE